MKGKEEVKPDIFKGSAYKRKKGMSMVLQMVLWRQNQVIINLKKIRQGHGRFVKKR